MATFTCRSMAFLSLAAAVLVALLTAGAADAQKLSPNFYSKTCPNVATIVRQQMASAVAAEKRMGASILRMFFHDCFVNVRDTYTTAASCLH
jgi:peroxidase